MIRNLPRWLALSLVFIFIVGAVFTWWTVVEKDGQMRQQLLTETRLGATGIRIENVAELTAEANTFADKQLPILKALGIA